MNLPLLDTPHDEHINKVWGPYHALLFVLLNALLVTIVIGAVLYYLFMLDIPDIASLASYQPPITTTIYDKNGEIVEQVYDQNRFVVSLDRLPDLLPKAFIAAEDGRFYEHHGVDGWSILRAFFHNLKVGDRSQGGSTITQQVARSLLLSPEKTYSRKLKEAILAYRIDRILSKNDILHIYLNQIYLGENAYGVEAASRIYFGKHARELSLAESSLLAGLPQAPSRYSPFKHLKLARKRQMYVLNRMAEVGFIAPEEARQAYRQPLFWQPKTSYEPSNFFFLQHVKNYVEQKYGEALLKEGGLAIHTTLDQTLQENAARSIKQAIQGWSIRQNNDSNSKNTPQAALIVMDNANGDILAMMGGTNFNESQFNRATQALRQPGSAFKPIIYAGALENGLTPATLIVDEPLQLQGVTSDHVWEPQNFDGTFQGPTTLRNGLVFSRNIVTIKILQMTGINNILDLAKKCGIRSPLAANLSLALGVSDVSLLEITGAYAVFARGGNYLPPRFITKITDKNGNIIEQTQSNPQRVIDRRTAFQVTHLLKQVIADGTGRWATGLYVDSAGKTP